jgi:predicted ATPase
MRFGWTFAALLAQLDGLAARQPVLIIFEDVQWIAFAV